MIPIIRQDVDKNGATPEHLAAGQGHLDAVLSLGFRRPSGGPHPRDNINR
jgi:ankyrin repeat protein